MEQDKNLICEDENGKNSVLSPCVTVTKTIGKITYIVDLYFKNEGQTFQEKLKRILRAETED